MGTSHRAEATYVDDVIPGRLAIAPSCPYTWGVYYTPVTERQLDEMSKGTKVFTVRINEHLAALITETIGRRNLWTRSLPWTWTDFIHTAVREKIAKMKRSRRPRRRTTRPPTGSAELPTLADTGAIA